MRRFSQAYSICIGPSAPLGFAPERTPGALLKPLFDSTVPIAARIVHGSPGQVAAARWYRSSRSIRTAVPPAGPEEGFDPGTTVELTMNPTS